MNKLVALRLSSFLFASIFSVSAIAEISIPKLDNAQVFAEFNDELPAVANYFTPSSQEEIVSFYKRQYGEVVQLDDKYGRLTYHFANNSQKIRIAISTQGEVQEVDIFIE